MLVRGVCLTFLFRLWPVTAGKNIMSRYKGRNDAASRNANNY